MTWISGKDAAKQRGISERDLSTSIANEHRFMGGRKRAEPQKTPGRSPGANSSRAGVPGGASPGAAGGIRTGYNADDQAVNAGSIGDRLARESELLAPGLAGDGARAAQDFRKSQRMGEQAQVRRGLAQENAQQNMQEQAARSELMQMAMSNQAKVYGDMAQRAVSQIGLASQLQSSLLRHRNSLIQALMQQ